MNEYLYNNSTGLFGNNLNENINEIVNTSNYIYNTSNNLATDINNTSNWVTTLNNSFDNHTTSWDDLTDNPFTKTSTDINFSLGGNVGIGKTNPSTALDVNVASLKYPSIYL